MKNTKSKKRNASLFKDQYEQKGITLIALIITIIVMLILVGVTISISLQGGLFGYAKKATKDTKNALEQEKTLANGDIIDYYLNVSQEVQGLPEYDKAEKTKGILTENAKYVEGTNIAIIPKGFKMSDQKEEQSITNGLVIQDEAGNEYVWVPVKDGTLDRTGWFDNEPTDKTVEEITENWTKDDYKQYIARKNGYSSFDEYWAAFKEENDYNNPEGYIDDVWDQEDGFDGYKDWASVSVDNIKDYTETLPEDLINSVKEYKGFYIGRYEAGSEEPRTSAKKDTLTEVLTKKGLYPYNFVSQTNAVSKIKEMYTEESYGVKAILPYGAMWDETLRFVKDDEHNVTNSTNWGNCYDTTFKFTGKYCETPIATSPKYTEGTNIDKPKNTGWLLTTGASEENKAKNIYDLAGNVWEWTQESGSTSSRVRRGGGYSGEGGSYPASNRISNVPSSTDSRIGFRSALYIK